MGSEAITVLLRRLNSIPRSLEFAESWNTSEVWSLMGKAQLDQAPPMVKEVIFCFDFLSFFFFFFFLNFICFIS
jgi:hypothetical protein